MSGSKILRAIVTEIEVDEVAVFPSIRESSGKSLMLAVEPFVIADTLGVGFSVLSVFQCSAHSMVIEIAAVVQNGLEKLFSCTFRRRTVNHCFFIGKFMENHVSVAVPFPFSLPEFGPLFVKFCVLVEGVESKTPCELQSFGDELQILFQCDVGLYSVVPFFFVSVLRGKHPRVSFIACAGTS